MGKYLSIKRIREFKGHYVLGARYNDVLRSVAEHYKEYQYKTFVHPNPARNNSKALKRKWAEYLAQVAERDKLQANKKQLFPVLLSTEDYNDMVNQSYRFSMLYKVLIQDVFIPIQPTTVPHVILQYVANKPYPVDLQADVETGELKVFSHAGKRVSPYKTDRDKAKAKKQPTIVNVDLLKCMSYSNVEKRLIVDPNGISITDQVIHGLKKNVRPDYSIKNDSCEIIYDLRSGNEYTSHDAFGMHITVTNNEQKYDAYLPLLHTVFNVEAVAYTQAHEQCSVLDKLNHVQHPITGAKIRLMKVDLLQKTFYNEKYNARSQLYCLIPSNFLGDREHCKSTTQPLFGTNGDINSTVLPPSYQALSPRQAIIDKLYKELGGVQTSVTVIHVQKPHLVNNKTAEKAALTAYVRGEQVIKPELVDIVSQIPSRLQQLNQFLFDEPYAVAVQRPILKCSQLEDFVIDSLQVAEPDRKVWDREKKVVLPTFKDERGENYQLGDDLFLKPGFSVQAGRFVSQYYKPQTVHSKYPMEQREFVRNTLLSNDENNNVVISDTSLCQSQMEMRLLVSYIDWYRNYFKDQTKRIKPDIVGWVSRISEHTRPWDYYMAHKIATTEKKLKKASLHKNVALMNELSSDLFSTFFKGYLSLHQNERLVHRQVYHVKEVLMRTKFVYEILGAAIYHLAHVLYYKYPKLVKYYFDTIDFKVPKSFTNSSVKNDIYELGRFSVFLMGKFEEIIVQNGSSVPQKMSPNLIRKLRFPNSIIDKVEKFANSPMPSLAPAPMIYFTFITKEPQAVPLCKNFEETFRLFRAIFSAHIEMRYIRCGSFSIPRIFDIKKYYVFAYDNILVKAYLVQPRNNETYKTLKALIGQNVTNVEEAAHQRLLEMDKADSNVHYRFKNGKGTTKGRKTLKFRKL